MNILSSAIFIQWNWLGPFRDQLLIICRIITFTFLLTCVWGYCLLKIFKIAMLSWTLNKMVRLPRFELGTSTLSVSRSNQLSYNRKLEARRFELLTLWMQIRCSTNWAKPPCLGNRTIIRCCWTTWGKWCEEAYLNLRNIRRCPIVLKRRWSSPTFR